MSILIRANDIRATLKININKRNLIEFLKVILNNYYSRLLLNLIVF